VLADGGVAVVDELDKMTTEDRSAMHEALEQQTVSIAKAGITATLNARCPVLAAANPKWGRFSSEQSLGEQFDLPPTLLSRFDVIFPIQDRPNQEKDRELASQILLSHQEGEARATLPPPPSATAGSEAAPFPPEFLKKYIAWARRHIRPVLSQQALEILENYYVNVRRQGEDPKAPVPITARQLEALVRLSEASARARLSPVVEGEDAQRAASIMESFLKRIASAEGKFDIDTVATGLPRGQKERMEVLMTTIYRLQARGDGTFSVEELKTEAEGVGVPPARTEALFHSLRNQGEVMESRPGRWQLVRFA
jgi:replicative DNA helicase Mcm